MRERLRHARRQLDESTQHEAAQAIAGRLAPRLDLLRPSVVAAYLATDGEISPSIAVEALRLSDVRTAFPRIEADVMTFHVVESDEQLVQGRWGLSEPPPETPAIDPTELDVILVPLVGFDTKLDRLGRGKAYYDRALAFFGATPRPSAPVLIGLAHDLQLVAAIDARAHDIALDAVITPTKIYGLLPS
ncbi:MAG: 5-formyltetrahydrofolate cyclo-ligase [Acidimicrobiales bacterium]